MHHKVLLQLNACNACQGDFEGEGPMIQNVMGCTAQCFPGMPEEAFGQ